MEKHLALQGQVEQESLFLLQGAFLSEGVVEGSEELWTHMGTVVCLAVGSLSLR